MSDLLADLVPIDEVAGLAEAHERLRQLHRSYFTELRAIVAASTPPETVALVKVHLIEWPAEP